MVPDGLLRPGRSPWFQWRGQREWLLAGTTLAGTMDPAGTRALLRNLAVTPLQAAGKGSERKNLIF